MAEINDKLFILKILQQKNQTHNRRSYSQTITNCASVASY